MTQVILVLTNVPDQQAASDIAAQLVEKNLAACVNCLPGVKSVYRWESRIEEASEICLLIKTTSERYAAVEEAIKALHPYALPEIIALNIERGLPAYLQWVAQESKKERYV